MMKRDHLLQEVAEVMESIISNPQVIETTDGVSRLLAAREVLSLPKDYDQRKKLTAQRIMSAMENTRTYRVYTKIVRKRGIVNGKCESVETKRVERET